MRKFKRSKAFSILLLGISTTFVAAQSNVVYLGPPPKAMTVQDVIKLSKAGLSDDTIIEQIKTKNQHFDLTTDQLLQLKAGSVSDHVIQVMINPAYNATMPLPAAQNNLPSASTTTTSISSAATKADDQKSVPTEIGVYVKARNSWSELLPEVVNWKTGGVVKSVASAGIVKGDINGHVNGSRSANHLTAPIELLIVVPEGVAVTEYQFLRLHEHDGYREFRTVTGGVFHVSGGATRDLVPFEGTKIAPRSYLVTINTSSGQYGFLPPGAFTSMNAASSGKIYSFGIME